jgi:hypothetical protein
MVVVEAERHLLGLCIGSGGRFAWEIFSYALNQPIQALKQHSDKVQTMIF